MLGNRVNQFYIVWRYFVSKVELQLSDYYGTGSYPSYLTTMKLRHSCNTKKLNTSEDQEKSHSFVCKKTFTNSYLMIYNIMISLTPIHYQYYYCNALMVWGGGSSIWYVTGPINIYFYFTSLQDRKDGIERESAKLGVTRFSDRGSMLSDILK